MQYVRLFAGPDGESHFEDVLIELSPIAEYAKGVPEVHLSAPHLSTALTFLSAPPGFFGDWHPAPDDSSWSSCVGRQSSLQATVSDGS